MEEKITDFIANFLIGFLGGAAGLAVLYYIIKGAVVNGILKAEQKANEEEE